MTQRRLLEQRRAGMDEIGEIMRSMKNLAFMETRKLERLLANQRALVKQIDAAAADFLAFHQQVLPAANQTHRIFLVVGSRRGFCGDFNERLHRRWRTETTDTGAPTASTIAVGHKLCLRLAEDRAPVLRLDGADVAEEIPAVLAAVVKELGVQQAERGLVTLTVLWHRDPGAEPVLQNLLPPFDAYRGAEPTHGFAPVLNLAPRTFLLGLVEQYLFAALHTVLFESLLAENEQRVRHLDGAVRHLEEREETLERRIRALRQEEIIEEIEVILLNAAGPDERSAG